MACFVAETDTWTPEAEPVALDKIAEVASSTALRVSSAGALRASGTERTGDVVSQRLEGAGELSARTFLAFVDGGSTGGDPEATLAACFVLCVGACGSSVLDARFDGPAVAAPPPTLVTRVVMALVHHPAATGWGAMALAVSAGAAAIATRKRPRAR